jgi:hypothetical protein
VTSVYFKVVILLEFQWKNRFVLHFVCAGARLILHCVASIASLASRFQPPLPDLTFFCFIAVGFVRCVRGFASVLTCAAGLA